MGGLRNRLQLKNTVYLMCFHFINPCGHYGRYYGVTDRSNRTVAVTVGPITNRVGKNPNQPGFLGFLGFEFFYEFFRDFID